MRFKKISRAQWYSDYIEHDNVTIADSLYEDIKLPKRATSGSAGYDFFAPYDITIPPNQSVLIPTGIRWVCNENERDRVLLIAPRSGMGFKTGVRLMNTLGIIDADFAGDSNTSNSGHIAIKLYNPQDEPLKIKQNQAFAQGFIVPFMVCDGDNVNEKRNGGFGSTDIY